MCRIPLHEPILLDRTIPLRGPAGTRTVYPTFLPDAADHADLDRFLAARSDRFGAAHAAIGRNATGLGPAGDRGRSQEPVPPPACGRS